MSEIRRWLEAIGFGQYSDAFEVNKIDMDLLGQVDDPILKDIGVSAAGDRLRLRNAIAKLNWPPLREVTYRRRCGPDVADVLSLGVGARSARLLGQKSRCRSEAFNVDAATDIVNQSVTSPSRACRGTRMRPSQIAR